MANWYDMLKDAMEQNGDRFEDRICTLSEDRLKIEFNAGGGGSAYGAPFVAWGEYFIYFPVQYDGVEWVESATRNPVLSDSGDLIL